MKLYAGRRRMCRRNVKPAQYQVRKIECEKPHDAAGQFFPPSYDLMLVVEISRHPPNALAVFLSKGVPIGVTDNFQNCFANNLKSVTDHWRREIIIRYRNILVGAFRELRFCSERSVAINGYGGERLSRALRVRGRENGEGKQSSSERSHCYNLRRGGKFGT